MLSKFVEQCLMIIIDGTVQCRTVPFYHTKIKYIECHRTNQIPFQYDLKDCLCSLIFKKQHKINNLKVFSLDYTNYKWCYLNFAYTSVLFVNPVSGNFPSALLVHLM